MALGFGGYALLFSNIAELGWIYSGSILPRRRGGGGRRARARARARRATLAAADTRVLRLNGRPQGEGCHHPSLNLAGYDASAGRGLAREGHRVPDRG